MKQKITLRNGVVTLGMIRPFHPSNGARNTPAIKLTRLRQLLKTQHPSICVVRGEGIGDVLTITPTLHALREMFANVTITVATNTSYLDGALVKVLKYNTDIDHILERELIDDSKYDLVINLHCPAIKNEKQGKMPLGRIDVFANHAGVTLKDPKPRYFIKEDEIEYGKLFLKEFNSREKILLVQPFASAKNRTFDSKKIKETLINLNREHGIRSLILTHDGDPNNLIWDNIPGSKLLKNLDIRNIAGIMVHCDMVLCPDSSILHLAGALEVPTVALFGPSPPKIRIKYYKNAVGIWRGENIPACPCFYDNCPTRYTCWDRITTQDIEVMIIKHLKDTKRINIVDVISNIGIVRIETEVI